MAWLDYSDELLISIHALLAESDLTSEVSDNVPLAISIHALLAESDQVENTLSKIIDHFYPRSPCGERQPAPGRDNKHNIFLSTLSLRRATEHANNGANANLHFYPRSPCGERPDTSSVQCKL